MSERDDLDDIKKRAGIVEDHSELMADMDFLDNIPKAVGVITAMLKGVDLGDYAKKSIHSALNTLMDTSKALRKKRRNQGNPRR
jgi:hypothetical protein